MFEVQNRLCSPELLAKVAEATNQAVVITKFGFASVYDHKIIYVNPAFTKLTGFAAPDVIGRSPDAICDPRTGSKEIMHFYQNCNPSKGFSAKLSSFRKDGGELKLDIHVKPVTDDVTGSTFYLIICDDPAPSKMVEQKLSDMLMDEKIANYSKSQFLSHMSHDLRTPLNAIIGFSEVIKNELFGNINNPKYISYAADIHKSGVELLAKINEVFEISETQVKNPELKEEEINLSELIENILGLLFPKAFRAELHIKEKLSTHVVMFLGDRRKIKQAFAGIISTAIRLSTGNSDLEVSSRLAHNGDYLFFLSAPGLNLLELNLLSGNPTEFFAKGSESFASPSKEEAFLELSLAKTFVELHGGTLTVSNSTESGTEIKVVLPADRILSASRKENKGALKVA